MKKRSLMVALLVVSSAIVAAAQEDAHRQLAEELLTLMDVQKNIEQVFEVVRSRHLAQLNQMGVTGEDAAKAEAVQGRVMDLIIKEMSWNKLKEDYISVYADTFTDEELQGIIDFYKSPPGRKFLDKMPELMQRSMAISQKQMMELMPKIQALTREAAGKPVVPSVPAQPEAGN